jgi:hypothetical protein
MYLGVMVSVTLIARKQILQNSNMNLLLIPILTLVAIKPVTQHAATQQVQVTIEDIISLDIHTSTAVEKTQEQMHILYMQMEHMCVQQPQVTIGVMHTQHRATNGIK